MAKEYTVEEKLQQLHYLQTLDTQLNEFEVLKGELPIEVKDLEDEIEGLYTRVNKLERGVEGLQDEVNQHIAVGKEAEALIVRYKEQLNNVKNNREYEALTKELEMQELDIKLSEKRAREATQALDSKKKTLEVANERLTQKEKELQIKQVELKEIIEHTEKEEKKVIGKIEKARKIIEPRLLKAYDKIRNSYRNRLSVVTVERNSCGGCYNKIPPQLQLEIGMRKKIIACEHCGRILVDNVLAGVAEEEEV